MADRIPVSMVVIFDDGQALFLHSEQMMAFGLRYAGAIFPKSLEVEGRTREEVAGYAFDIMVNFALAPGGVDAETVSVCDAIEPYLIHFTEIPPIDPNTKTPAPSGLVNWPLPATDEEKQ